METLVHKILTFKPLKKGRYRCNQENEITTNPKKYRNNYYRAIENTRKQKERELQLKNIKKRR